MAGKGGGAWKVAYADFVTAMMAFFLVMWICGQDQKIRRSVSDYFSDPMGSPDSGPSKKPSRSGSTYESINTGSVPLEEQVAMGRGRRAFGQKRKSSPATKVVNDWIYGDAAAGKYWKKQAEDQREAARWSKNVKQNGASVEREAVRQLTLQLQEEVRKDIPAQATGIYRDLMNEALFDVNWDEIAQDLLGN